MEGVAHLLNASAGEEWTDEFNSTMRLNMIYPTVSCLSYFYLTVHSGWWSSPLPFHTPSSLPCYLIRLVPDVPAATPLASYETQILILELSA